MTQENQAPEDSVEDDGRRKFLEKCGRFAIVTPPAMTMLLSVAVKPREAYASTILGGGWRGRPKPPFPPRLPLPPIWPR